MTRNTVRNLAIKQRYRGRDRELLNGSMTNFENYSSDR